MFASYKSKLGEYLAKNGYVGTFAFHDISGNGIIQKFGYPARP